MENKDESHYCKLEYKCYNQINERTNTMAKKYNGLNSIKIDLAQCGICAQCGRRFTDPQCQHATPEQIKYTQELDAQVDAEYEAKKIYRNRVISVAQEYDLPDPTDAAECADIQEWLGENFDDLPEVEF